MAARDTEPPETEAIDEPVLHKNLSSPAQVFPKNPPEPPIILRQMA
jgi:hypothetical protein